MPVIGVHSTMHLVHPNYRACNIHLLEVTKQQMCIKYSSSGLHYSYRAYAVQTCKSFQQGHCPASNKSVAYPHADRTA